jgi:hypothetical protein
MTRAARRIPRCERLLRTTAAAPDPCPAGDDIMTPRTPRVALAAVTVALATAASFVFAQPKFQSASPTAGGTTSQQANQNADKTLYESIDYTNRNKPGPQIIVIPGEIKSNNATFLQRFSANNIADYGELELANANFKVLERSNLGPVMREFELAYNLGDPQAARKVLGIGKIKTTKYIVKFDILKTEQVASAQKGFDGGTLGQMAGLLGGLAGSRGAATVGAVGSTALGSVHSGEATSVWVIGMRYKIIDAETTDQLAQGYTEEKMEVGATSGGALGARESQQGGAGLDTMVQRLVQKSVWEIDSRYK